MSSPTCWTAGSESSLARVHRLAAIAFRRIVANLAAPDPGAVAAFYRRLFDLAVVMDHGWIVTVDSRTTAPAQLSIASEGGSGTPVPDLSIEVDDVDETHRRAVAFGHDIVYPITDEPWGVRRFYLPDPCGKLLSILAHA